MVANFIVKSQIAYYIRRMSYFFTKVNPKEQNNKVTTFFAIKLYKTLPINRVVVLYILY